MRQGMQSGLLLLMLASQASELSAGPVNSPGSYPFAKASSRNDRVTLGNLKSLVYWQEKGVERAGLVPWRQSWSRTERFTGGIAEASERKSGAPAAIACAGDETQIFHPERNPAAPAGVWKNAETLGTGPQGARRCAMQKTGAFAEFFPSRSTLVLNRTQSFSIPSGFQTSELLAAGEGFMLMSSSKALSFYLRDAKWVMSSVWNHGVSSVGPDTRWDGQDRLLLKADPDGYALASIRSGSDGPRLSQVQRLPVSPCETDQVCGLSLAQDESWLLSGYWGHYLGRGQQFMRLNLPLSVEKGAGAVAIAHAGAGGRFTYLGWDDGDQGILPNLPQNPTETRAQPDRYMTWIKRDDGAVQMEVWNGPLPDDIPRHWLAWEPGYEWSFADEPMTRAAADDRWWLDRLGAQAAWTRLKAAGIRPAPVRVAVIDSGADPSHPWLQEQLDRKAREIPKNGLDDDDNGYVDDVWGYDFVEEDAVPQDDFGHGSHVAGLMIARKGDDIRNPAPNLSLMVVRALDRSGKSNSIDLARALYYAADNGAELVNCSWGGGPDTQALRDAFAMLRERGILVFSSAGNDRLDTDKSPDVPKKYSGVVSVAASDKNNRLADFSSYGANSVRFITPGDAIVSTIPGGAFGEKSGTSMASPLAVASFALLWGAVRDLEPELDKARQIEKVDRLLCETAEAQGVEKRSQCGRIRLDVSVEKLLNGKE
ncbi:MAG TPA: S8 family serine peptidase [Oligoflexus sp.]|uniref:S8 family serine peptidase n=1 Tax=Oligoflexus sp. TaxID=1971216 RepID=UPI002D804245|nr:S8 family serine peptidase [Oligoflexus sp.]HET9238595.1 S8 family serine peptidase [Oligoflexus sp.]